MPSAIEGELDQLYAADLGEFVRRRNELARRLRKEGDPEEAARIQALQKPSVVVWAANQLARRAPADLRRLLEAGERLERAQRKLLKGGEAAALEEARAAHEDGIRRAVGAARRLLEEGRGSATDATLDRLAATLRAASLQDQPRDLLGGGRLEEEIEPAGFEALAGMGGGIARVEPRRRKSGQAGELREAVKQARERERELQAEARQAAREAAKARRHADKLEKEASAAARQAEDAAATRAEAERRLADARS